VTGSETQAPNPSPIPSKEKVKTQAQTWWSDHARRTADCTLLLASGTIALAIFSLIQISETRTALHVTERAYVTAGSPTLDPTTKFITFLLNNSGHIPSGKVEIIVHEATTNATIPNAEGNIYNSVEYHWKRHKFSLMPPSTNSFAIKAPVPQFSEDKFTVQGAYQQLIVAGRVSYDDGFPDDGPQTSPFCFGSQYHTMLKQIFLVPCDPELVIPKMENHDGYPGNEAKD
jgi:hypothetical protein